MVVDFFFKIGRVAWVNEVGLDAQWRQGLGKQVVGPSVNGGSSYDFVTRPGYVQDSRGDRCRPSCQRYTASAAFQALAQPLNGQAPIRWP